jgi:ferritin
MSPAIIAAFERQAAQELYTSKAYLAMAYWSEVNHWGGYAKLFHLQASEEQEHARKFFDHLADRDVVPAVGAVGAATSTFGNLVEVAKAAYDLERANTKTIHALYELALAEKDYAAQVFLHAFITEQVEEEAWTDKLLEKTRQASCAGAQFNFDRHVVKEVLGDLPAEA